MKRNPFLDLFTPQLDNPQGELVEGSFSCQKRACYTNPVGEARYLAEIKVLTWVCRDEHINRIEGFRIDG